MRTVREDTPFFGSFQSRMNLASPIVGTPPGQGHTCVCLCLCSRAGVCMCAQYRALPPTVP